MAPMFLKVFKTAARTAAQMRSPAAHVHEAHVHEAYVQEAQVPQAQVHEAQGIVQGAMLARRAFVIGAPLALAGCVTNAPPAPLGRATMMYGPVDGEPFQVDAVDLSEVDPIYLRQEVAAPPGAQPGTILVDIDQKFLYYVQRNGRAIRYGVGVGKQGYSFKGWATIKRKEKWPHWTPTANMIRLQPARYGPYAGGLPGGEENPLGPRALYLYEGDRDTMFRIHGTTEPWSIGTQVSSGCIRLLNQDIIDLYERVPLGTRVYVKG